MLQFFKLVINKRLLKECKFIPSFGVWGVSGPFGNMVQVCSPTTTSLAIVLSLEGSHNQM